MRESSGPVQFAAQMLLQPVSLSGGRLDPSLLRLYESEIAFIKELKRLEINNIQMISASAWWDPSFAAESGDRSVLAILYATENAHLYLQHLEVIYPEGGIDEETDNATAQCRIVAELLKRHMMPSVAVEINGIGRFLPGLLRRELQRINSSCRVLEVSSRRGKDLRILEAFDALLAGWRLHVHRRVMNTPFATEMHDWRPRKSGGHDDCLDAVAGAISLRPARLGSLPSLPPTQSWTGATQTAHADTDFAV